MKVLALNVVAPAGPILAGALLQQGLVSVWPAVQDRTIYSVNLDSYFGALVLGGLTFWVGVRLRRSAPARAMVIPSLIVPTIWLLLFQFAVYPPPQTFNALRVVYTLIAVAPFAGIGLAYALPSNNRWSDRDAH